MELGETVIVAGIGSRKGVSAAEVMAAIDAALKEHGLERSALKMLATTAFKREEKGIFEAGRMMGIEVVVVPAEASIGALRAPSTLSFKLAGVSSVAEAAALAAAGEGARLAGPRIAVGPATCAIAFGEDG